MANKYREDKDLEFLKLSSNDMLGLLVKFLTTDEDGELRHTEELTENDDFKEANGDYSKVWRLIASELQSFGGDTIVNKIRGHGVTYREVLTDVCDRLRVKYESSHETVKIEDDLLKKIFKESWGKMSDEEKEEVIKMLDVNPALSKKAAFDYIYSSIGKIDYLTYHISLALVAAVAHNLIGRGVTVLLSQLVIGRTTSVFFGPIGFVLAGLASLPILSGPAYRVTIPAVLQVAAMRKQLICSEKGYF